jgi:hypothetical protein
VEAIVRSLALLEVSLETGPGAELFAEWLLALPRPNGGVPVHVRAGPSPGGPSNPPAAWFGDQALHVVEGGFEIRGPRLAVRTVSNWITYEHHAAEGHEVARALALALDLFARPLGVFQLHAASVLFEDALLILPAGSGSGKTSTAIALCHAGARWMSDDSTFFAGGSVWGWPRAMHVTEDTAAAFGFALRGKTLREGVAKVRWTPPFPALAEPVHSPPFFLHPALSCGVTRIEPLPDDEALTLLLGSSALALIAEAPGGDAHLEILGQLAVSRPHGRLHLGVDTFGKPNALAQIVRGWLGSL